MTLRSTATPDATDPSVPQATGVAPAAAMAQPPAPEEFADLDPSLATHWPRTATGRALVLAALTAVLGLAYAPAIAADGIAWLFTPVLLGGVAAAMLVLDLPLRATTPSRAATAAGVLGAALCVVGGFLVARTLAGTADTLGAATLVAVTSAAVFTGAVLLSDWERRFFAATRRVVFIGEPVQLSELRREVHRHRGMRLVGHLPVACEPSQLDALVDAERPTLLVFSGAAAASRELCDAAVRWSTAGIRVATLTDLYRDHFGRVPLRELTPSWSIREIADLHRPRTYVLAKHILERSLSAIALVLLAPVLAVAALAIRLSGPVLYRQERVGHRGEVITVLKLRTMVPVSEAERGAWAQDDLHRVTRVGRLLRRLRLDEAPQLLGVVRGDMSLIGPRPEQVAIVARLREELEFYDARHWVRPGLTGWAQIKFGYGGSLDGARQKLEYDLYYVERQSLMLDLRIILGTARAVIRGVGA